MSAAKPTTPRASSSPAPASRPRLAVRGSSLSWLTKSALACGVGVSVLAHSLLLVTGFSADDGGLRKEHDKGLKVVLVNAKHKRSPKDAQALAQANLDGGGEQDKKELMPSSPLPAQDAARDGNALMDSQQKVQQLESVQRQLLAQAKAADTRAARERQSKQEAQTTDTPQPKNGLDLSTATAIARQEAVVDKGVADYAARPRKGHISPRTREYKLAQYGEDWRLKVQRVGELNFPRGLKGSLYGSVQVNVELRADGSVISIEIGRPDRNPKINEAALRIIKLASPYAPFPPDIRKEYDVLVISRTMNFTREDIGVGDNP